MRRWLIIAALAAGFVAGLIAMAPAALLPQLLGPDRGVSAREVTGTIWRSEWRDAVVAGVPVAHVEARLSALALVTGAAEVEWRVADPRITGSGRARLRGDDWRIEAETLRLNPAGAGALGPSTPAVWRVLASAPVHVTGLSVEGRGDMCQSAQGEVRLAGLADAAAAHGLDAPVLTGPVSCAGSGLGAALSGASDALSVTGDVRLSSAALGWRMVLEPRSPAMSGVLVAAGIERQPDGRHVSEGSQVWR